MQAQSIHPKKRNRRILLHGFLRQFGTQVLIALMLVNQSLAAPHVYSFGKDFVAWIAARGTAMQGGPGSNILIGQGRVRPARRVQERQEDRDQRVTQITLHPGDATIQVGEMVQLSAVARDGKGVAVPGAKFNWSGIDENRNRPIAISSQGEFVARDAGVYRIRVESGFYQKEARITVKGGDPRGRSVRPLRTIEVSSTDAPRVSRMSPRQRPAERNASPARSAYATSFLPAAKAPKPIAYLPEPGTWNETNLQMADDPGRERGMTIPGRPSSVGSGSGNFSFSAPLLSLSGRGVDLSLSMIYNARLWNRLGEEMIFDIDKDWPAAGFSLGFGRIIGTGGNGGYMIVDPDGVHRSYQGRVLPYVDRQEYLGRTSDGSFIDYSVEANSEAAGGAPRTATARLANGTIIRYGAPGRGAVYPTRITDASGNYITITYRNNAGPAIDAITDTLTREIRFHYDSANRLTAITGPGLGGAMREIVRLHYKPLTLNAGFPGLTIRYPNNNSTIEVLDAIYYPATGSGYWFGDADSYSSYGMLAKISERRGMTFSSTSLNFQGTVTAGSMSRQVVYNFPLQPAALADAPLYTTRTESWAGMDSAPAVTTYSAQVNANPRSFTVINPDGAKNVQISYYKPYQFDDGLLYQQQTFQSASQLIPARSSTITWGQGSQYATWFGANVYLYWARPIKSELAEASLPVKTTEYLYDNGLFNQITSVREYDYSGALARITRTEYENAQTYLSRHIFNLVKVQEILGPDGTRASRNEFRYDEAPLEARPGISQFDQTYNPYAPGTQQCNWVPDPNDPDCNNPNCSLSDPFICDGYCPFIYSCETIPVFNAATAYRGQVTSAIRYADAANQSGAITETRRYDIAGNLVSLSNASCCEQSRIEYTSATQFAYPVSQTRGSSTDATKQIRTQMTWDVSLGVPESMTDANNGVTDYVYNPTTLRAETVFLPTGAYTYRVFQDAALLAAERVYGSDGLFAGGGDRYLNGAGAMRAEVNYSADTHADVVNGNYQTETVSVEYDVLGRVRRQSRPYSAGETPAWGTVQYDWDGRPILLTAADGSQTQYFHNERNVPSGASGLQGMSLRTVDAWGRERWARTDALGRLAEVLEPNPLGAGSLAAGGSLRTEYLYDTLDRLVQTQQGSQRRYFRYDSLGRLTHQKLAEQAGTINEAGGAWSSKFEYDDRSNLTRMTDARGVVTNYFYNGDPLDRLQAITYAIPAGAAATVAPAANVNYSYMTSGDVTRIRTVTDGMGAEEYAYDSYGRITQVARNLPSRPALVTNYDYDSLGRIRQSAYPSRFGIANNPRSVLGEKFRVGGTTKDLTLDGAVVASQLQYTADDQLTSVTLGNGGVDTYSYDGLTGLLTGQRIMAGGETLLNSSFGYGRAGSTGKTGQLTQITDALDANRNRAFEYDPLGRLKKVTGNRGGAPWTQEYQYDQFGNREQVRATGSLIAQAEPMEFSVPDPQPAGKNQIALKSFGVAESSGRAAKDSPAIVTAADKSAAGDRALNAGSAFAAPQINRIPVSDPGGPYTGTVGTTITFNGSRSYDPDGTIVSYTWDFGDGTGGSGQFLGHAYSAPGTYTVSLRVRDNRNASRTATTTATITGGSPGNQAPVANAGGPYSAAVGASITFNGANSSDPDGTITSYAWYFGDGATGSGATPSKSYSAAGTYAVTLTVTDNQGATNSATASATITSSGATTPNYEGYFDVGDCNYLAGWAADRNRLNTSINLDVYDGATLILPNSPANQSRPDVAAYLGDNGLHGYTIPTPASLKNGQPHTIAIKFAGSSQHLIGSPRTITCAAPTSNNAAFVSQSVPATMAAGQSYPVTVTMTNTGTSPWTAAGNYKLGSQNPQDNSAWGVNRIALPASVAPGASATFSFTVTAPAAPGTYNFQWQMVQEGVGWFGAPSTNIAVTVQSAAPATPLTDGAPALSYDATTNRITAVNYEYDAAGNLTRGYAARNVLQRFQYDAANRLVRVTSDTGTELATYSYGADNRRLKSVEAGSTRWYGWSGDQLLVEYSDTGSLFWIRSYAYLGNRLLLTDSPTEGRLYHHPDRLGTRIVTNAAGAKVAEQAILPFGTALAAPETTGTPTNRRFTTYERSNATRLDYAVNRSYASWQGRFSQVDPLGMGAADLRNPQSLNLYAYVENDPVNFVDPTGLNSESVTCYIDGIQSSCGDAFRAVAVGVAVFGPADTTHWNPRLNGGKGGWEQFSVDASGMGRWGYWEHQDYKTFLDGEQIGSWKDIYWITTRTIGSLTEWQGLLAFLAGGQIYNFRGRLIGEPPLDMGMAGPLDFIGPGGLFKGSLRVVGTSSLLNVTSKPRAINDALQLAFKWLKPGYKEIGKKGSGIFRSADGLRQFRMVTADILGKHGKIGPHVHFEKLNLEGEVIKNIHTPIF